MSESGTDRPLESRVEDLFSNAVERQVAERRAVGRALEELGRLVKSLDDRLARIEAAEQTRGQDGRQEVVGLGEQLDAVTARLDDVVGQGIEQLARRQDEAQQAIERAVLSAVADQPGGAGPDVDQLVERLAERLVAQQPRVDVDEIVERVVARIGGQQPPLDVEHLAEQVAARQPRVDVDGIVARVVTALPPSPGIDPEQLADAVARALPAPPTPPPPLDADYLLGRIGAVVDSARQPELDLDALVGELRGAVASASSPVDVGVIAQAVVDRLGSALPPGLTSEAVEESVRRSAPSAVQVASAVDASIRDGLSAVVDEVRDDVERLRDEVFAIRHEVADGLGGVQPMTARLTSELDELTEAIASIRLDLGRADGERDRLREDVGEVVAGLSANLEAAAADRARNVDVVSDRVRDEVGDVVAGLGNGIEERLGSLLEERLQSMADLREQVASDLERLQSRLATDLERLQGQLASTVDEVRTQMGAATERFAVVDELNTTLAEQSTRLDRLAVEMPASAAASFDERAGELVAEQQTLVRELATELGSALATVAERAEAAQEANARRVDDLGNAVTALAKQLTGVDENVATATGDLTAQREAMEAMTADVTGMGEAIGRVMGEMQAQLAADQELAIDQLRDVLAQGEQRLDQAGATLTTQADQAAERVAAAVEVVNESSAGLRAHLQAVLDEAAGEQRVDAEAARDEVIAAGARLDLLFDRLAGFERAVVEHLATRDALFSRERELLLHDLVDQLAGHLGKRERKKLAGKLEVPPAPAVDQDARARVPQVATPEPGDREVPARPRRKVDGDATEVVPKAKAVARRKPAAAPKRTSASKKPSASSRRVTREDLEAVSGLGPAKVDALVDALGSPAKVAAASADELAEVPGISARLAKAIVDHFA